jgi:type VI secretion system protein ImpK
MSDDNNPNRTVFRPSPLQGLRAPPAPEPPVGGVSPAIGSLTETPIPARLSDDDIPATGAPPKVRNVMMDSAARVLALAASVRSGRAQIELPRLHAEATAAIAAFERAVQAAGYPDEQRQRGKYALCATIDDIAQNLPGGSPQAAEWARRALLVQAFQDGTGGDRFWVLAEDMLKRPAQYADLIELFHACLAAGFEGRLRVTADGQRRHREAMISLYAALEHVRTLSMVELSPHWRGEPTPRRVVGFWSILALAAGVALAALMVIYIILRLILLETGESSLKALRAVTPDQPLRLSRIAPTPPVLVSGQLQTLRTFLADPIAQNLLVVEEDGSTVRIRTTVGQLFASGSDRLDPARIPLFHQIAAAIKTQPGAVKIEGYTDSDRVKTLSFPDNIALSQARAEAVAALIATDLGDAGRVSAQGYGDSRPVASNSDPAGKALNRRVEIVIPRTS